MTLNRKLLSMIALLWIGLVLIGAFGAWQARSSMLADRREQLRALMQQAQSVAGHYYRLAQKGAKIAADFIEALGYEVTREIGVTGVVGVMRNTAFRPMRAPSLKSPVRKSQAARPDAQPSILTFPVKRPIR
jgi:hypothetical protein